MMVGAAVTKYGYHDVIALFMESLVNLTSILSDSEYSNIMDKSYVIG